jgi:hypothetical protein
VKKFQKDELEFILEQSINIYYEGIKLEEVYSRLNNEKIDLIFLYENNFKDFSILSNNFYVAKKYNFCIDLSSLEYQNNLVKRG